MLLASAGMALAAVVATAASAAAAGSDCPGGAILLRNACVLPAYPTTTPLATTPPTTAVPLGTVPPVTLPEVSLPPVTTPPAPAGGSFVSVPQAAQHLLDLVNTERRQGGLGLLTSRDDIAAIALAHSQEMAQAGDIFHSTTFLSPAVKSLLGTRVGGENVAYNGDIDSAHARLMASPGHHANIMDPRFSVVGFAVVLAPDGRYFVTQDFIQPAGAPAPVVVAHRAPAVASRASPAPVPKPAPAVITVPPPPPVTTPPAPAISVAPAHAVPLVALGATSSAISAVSAHGAGLGLTAPASSVAVLLLTAAMVACCVALRRSL